MNPDQSTDEEFALDRKRTTSVISNGDQDVLRVDITVNDEGNVYQLGQDNFNPNVSEASQQGEDVAYPCTSNPSNTYSTPSSSRTHQHNTSISSAGSSSNCYGSSSSSSVNTPSTARSQVRAPDFPLSNPATPRVDSARSSTPRTEISRKKQKSLSGSQAAAWYSQPPSAAATPRTTNSRRTSYDPFIGGQLAVPSSLLPQSSGTDFATDAQGNHELASPHSAAVAAAAASTIATARATRVAPVAPLCNCNCSTCSVNETAAVANCRNAIPKSNNKRNDQVHIKEDSFDEHKKDDDPDASNAYDASATTSSRKPWLCKICNQTLVSDRRRHMNDMHENTDRYYCWICFKDSRQPWNLQEHRCNFGARTFRCENPLCLFRGASAAELMSHLCAERSHLVLMPDIRERYTAQQVLDNPQLTYHPPGQQLPPTPPLSVAANPEAYIVDAVLPLSTASSSPPPQLPSPLSDHGDFFHPFGPLPSEPSNE